MEKQSLWDIVGEMESLDDMLTENSGELTPEIEQALALNKSALYEKGQNIVNFIHKLEGDVELIKSEKKRIERIQEVAENKIKSIKTLLANVMDFYGIKKLDFVTNSATLQESAGSVEISDEADISDEYKTKVETWKIDKAAIGAALKEGKEVGGATLKKTKFVKIK